MDRDKYALYVDTNEILETMFFDYILDRNIDSSDKKELRTALASFVAQIEKYLIDDYELDPEEVSID